MKVFCIAAIVLTLGIVASALNPQVLSSLAGGGEPLKAGTDAIKTPVETVAKGTEAVVAKSAARRRRDLDEIALGNVPKEEPSVSTDDKKEEVKSRRRRDVEAETTVDAESPKIGLPNISTDIKKEESRRRRHDEEAHATVGAETPKVQAPNLSTDIKKDRRRRDVEAEVAAKVDTPKLEDAAEKATDSKDTDSTA